MNDYNILVTGCTGQLGYDIVEELKKNNFKCISATRNDFDLTNVESVRQFILNKKPTHIIHCAAYTQVDKAEDEVELCNKVNVEATECIANICKELNIPLMYFSTDYVFSGNGDKAFEVTDETSPVNVYGFSKLNGERAIQKILDKYFIIRISWVFGINGKNFVKTMLNLANSHKELRIVNDQIGSPTYTADIAKLVVEMIQTNKYGIYHATNEGYTSWADFAKKIFEIANKDVNIISVTTKEYGISKAKRPLNSRLSKKKLIENGFSLLPSWQDALERYIKKYSEI